MKKTVLQNFGYQCNLQSNVPTLPDNCKFDCHKNANINALQEIDNKHTYIPNYDKQNHLFLRYDRDMYS